MEVDRIKLGFELDEYKNELTSSNHEKLESEGEETNVNSHDEDHLKEDPGGMLQTKPFRCRFRPRSYVNCKSLDGHTNKKHPKNPEEKKEKATQNQIQDDETFIQCPLCPQSFASQKRTNFINHLKYNHAANSTVRKDKEGKLHCPLCPKFFRNKDALHKHIINIHVEHKPFECQICKSKNKCRKFIDQKGLDKHTTDIHGPPRFKCEICLVTFTHMSNLSRHKNTHLGTSKIKCQQCLRSFSSKSALDIHLAIKHKKKIPKVSTYTCELCGNIYGKIQELERHVASAHVADKSVECQLCGKMFVDESHLAHHVKTIHEGQRKIFNCDVCFKEFRHRRDFVRHLGVKHGRFFDCDKCSRSYETKTDFDQHSAVVSDSPELRCHICLVDLPSPCALSVHKESHVKEIKSTVKQVTAKQKNSPQVSKSNEKRFKCDLCIKTFSRTLYLVEHRKQVHPGSKWECKVCAETFKSRWQLTRHETIHSLFRPNECQVCQKRFKSQGVLTRHKLIHEQVKPHKCLTCSKSFTTTTGLRFHIANHHGGEKPFKCHLCEKLWSSKYQLEQHVISHSKERSFGCDTCAQNFKSRMKLQKHKKTVHKNTLALALEQEMFSPDPGTFKLKKEAYVCSLCDFQAQDKKEIAKHNYQHGVPRVLLSKYLPPSPADWFNKC